MRKEMSSPIRILHIIDNLHHTGTVCQTELLARGMPCAEFDVHVCSLSGDGPVGNELRHARISLETFDRRWPADPLTLWQLVQHVMTLRPDIIIGWQPAGRAYSAAAARCAGSHRLAAVWRSVEPNPSPWQRAADRFVSKRATSLSLPAPPCGTIASPTAWRRRRSASSPAAWKYHRRQPSRKGNCSTGSAFRKTPG